MPARTRSVSRRDQVDEQALAAPIRSNRGRGRRTGVLSATTERRSNERVMNGRVSSGRPRRGTRTVNMDRSVAQSLRMAINDSVMGQTMDTHDRGQLGDVRLNRPPPSPATNAQSTDTTEGGDGVISDDVYTLEGDNNSSSDSNDTYSCWSCNQFDLTSGDVSEHSADESIELTELTEPPASTNNVEPRSSQTRIIASVAPAGRPQQTSTAAMTRPLSPTALTALQAMQKAASSAIPPNCDNITLKRLKKELLDFLNDPPENCSAGLTDSNIFEWTATIIGPIGSPYENGVFKVALHLPQDYPFRPPSVRFLTKIYHCNISHDGYICLDVLDQRWSPALTIAKVLLSIASLLTDANPDDPLEMNIASLYLNDRKEHDKVARLWTRNFASPNYELENLQNTKKSSSSA